MFFLILLIFLLVGGAVVAVSVLNVTNQVQLSLYTMVTPYLPLGVLLLACFILGALLMYLFAGAAARKERKEMRQLRQRVTELEQASARVPSGKLSSPSGNVPPGAPQGRAAMPPPVQQPLPPLPAPGSSGITRMNPQGMSGQSQPPMPGQSQPPMPGMTMKPGQQGKSPIVHMPGMPLPPQN